MPTVENEMDEQYKKKKKKLFPCTCRMEEKV